MLRAAEHHCFEGQNGSLLFDVRRLTVIKACRSDKAILKACSEGATLESVISACRVAGLSESETKERIRTLSENGFLLLSNKKQRRVSLAEPTGYVTFMINVSQRCNLICPYCYVKRGRFDYSTRPLSRMPRQLYERIVDLIHKRFPGMKTYSYHFYGGEPLLNFSGIETIVHYAVNKAKETGTAVEFHITTNGTLLIPEISDFMDAHRFTIYLSIDGDQVKHDELRRYHDGRGSYKDLKRNLTHLQGRKGLHLIGSSVVREGLSLHEAMLHLSNHGSNQCKAERARLNRNDALSLGFSAHEKYLEDLRALVNHYIRALEEVRKPMDFRLSSKILQLLTRKRRDFFCPAGEKMFGISANGEIYPCALHVGRPHSLLGYLESGMNKKRISAFRRRFSSQGQMACRTCWTRYLCGGGCSAMVDRFGNDDCASLQAESEAAIMVYHHFSKKNPLWLLSLVSPKMVEWVNR